MAGFQLCAIRAIQQHDANAETLREMLRGADFPRVSVHGAVSFNIAHPRFVHGFTVESK
jgi:hypothetical protein